MLANGARTRPLECLSSAGAWFHRVHGARMLRGPTSAAAETVQPGPYEPLSRTARTRVPLFGAMPLLNVTVTKAALPQGRSRGPQRRRLDRIEARLTRCRATKRIASRLISPGACRANSFLDTRDVT
jgi:hypothetical protein